MLLVTLKVDLKWKGYIFKGDKCQNCFATLLKRVYSKGKEFAPLVILVAFVNNLLIMCSISKPFQALALCRLNHQMEISDITLRKYAISNILKILETKKGNFSDKNSDRFHISDLNIDCGYSLEPPRREVLTSTHNLWF